MLHDDFDSINVVLLIINNENLRVVLQQNRIKPNCSFTLNKVIFLFISVSNSNTVFAFFLDIETILLNYNSGTLIFFFFDLVLSCLEVLHTFVLWIVLRLPLIGKAASVDVNNEFIFFLLYHLMIFHYLLQMILLESYLLYLLKIHHLQ